MGSESPLALGLRTRMQDRDVYVVFWALEFGAITGGELAREDLTEALHTLYITFNYPLFGCFHASGALFKESF